MQVDVVQLKGTDLEAFLSADGGREQAMESRRRWSMFLDEATGYTAKQRGDKAKEDAKKFSKAKSAIKMIRKSIEMSTTVTQETIDTAPMPETTDDKFLIQIPIYGNESKIKSIIKTTDFYDLTVIDESVKKPDNTQDEEIHNFELTKTDSEITIGFVFHARKYSDGSSNLRIQFTRGRGQQYAKNSGLRIYRKHWISKKSEVSEKHPEYEKVNKTISSVKEKINSVKQMFADGKISFEDAYKEVIEN